MAIADNYGLAENADRARPDVFAVGVKFHALSSRFNLIFKEYPQAQRKGNLWQFFGASRKNLTFL
jgi:hypothetical protein